MKSEPLENKRKDIIVYLDNVDNSCNYDFKNSEDGEIFVFDDVKSAAIGLKGDIQRHIDQYERAIDLAEEKGLDELKTRLEKEVCGLRFALRRIDKWFKDVIE